MRSIAIAKELLARHPAAGEDRTVAIADNLAGGYHAHGHPISPTAAKTLGLPVELASADVAALLWKLVEDADQSMIQDADLDTAGLVLAEWQKRQATWRPAFSNLIATQRAAQGQPVTPSLADALGEAEAIKVSIQLPVVVTVEKTIGLIESKTSAATCKMTLRHVGSVVSAEKGLQVSSCPPVTLWEKVV